MLWTKIGDLSGITKLPGRFGTVFAIDIAAGQTPEGPTRWLIGPYKDLTPLATDLRGNADARQTLTDLRIRLGLRASDVPPTGERQVRYGEAKTGLLHDHNFVKDRKLELAKPVGADAGSTNRRGDRETNVLTFWQSQTPQSHHIVEYNNLRDIGASTKNHAGALEMDYQQLPAVLLAAEFHQRYISVFLKQAQGMGKAELKAVMPGLYYKLYIEHSQLFEPLWRISKLILEEAGLPVA